MPYDILNALNAPDPEFDLKEWSFIADLRPFFPKLTNNEIEQELENRGVIKPATDHADCESACTYVYFRTKKAATAFLKRLNKQPEIQNGIFRSYKEISASSAYVAILQPQWESLQKFLSATLTHKQYQALQTLNIQTQSLKFDPFFHNWS